MKWWDNLWLNEGFAKFMEYAVTSRLFPQWRTWDHFTATTQTSALSLDAMASTHPVEVAVSSPEEINEICEGEVVVATGRRLSTMTRLLG